MSAVSTRTRAARALARPPAHHGVLRGELLDRVLTFVSATCDAHAAGVAREWARGRRAWNLPCDRLCSIRSIAFAPDGATVAWASRKVFLHKVATGRELWVFDGGYRLGVCSGAVEFSPDGSVLVVGCDDYGSERQILVLNAATGGLKRRLCRSGEVLSLSGGLLAAGGQADKKIALIDWLSGEVRGLVHRDSKTHGICSHESLALTSGGSTLAICDSTFNGNEITFYDAASRDVLRAFEFGDNLRKVAFSPDGSKYAEYHALSQSVRGSWIATLETVSVHDAMTGTLLWEEDVLPEEESKGRNPPNLQFSHDSTTLAAPSRDGDAVALYDAETGELRRELGVARGFNYKYAVAFSPDDLTLAVCSVYVFRRGLGLTRTPTRLELYDTTTGELRRRTP